MHVPNGVYRIRCMTLTQGDWGFISYCENSLTWKVLAKRHSNAPKDGDDGVVQSALFKVFHHGGTSYSLQLIGSRQYLQEMVFCSRLPDSRLYLDFAGGSNSRGFGFFAPLVVDNDDETTNGDCSNGKIKVLIRYFSRFLGFIQPHYLYPLANMKRLQKAAIFTLEPVERYWL